MGKIASIPATKFDLGDLGYFDEQDRPHWLAVRNGLRGADAHRFDALRKVIYGKFKASPTVEGETEEAAQARREQEVDAHSDKVADAINELLSVLVIDGSITEDEEGELPPPTDPAFWKRQDDALRFAVMNWFENRRYNKLRNLGGDSERFTRPSASR